MSSLYSNPRYEVLVNGDGDGYLVRNKQTGVTEYQNSALPRCIIVAKESFDYLDRNEQEEAATAEAEAAPKPSNVISIPFNRGD